MKRLLCFFLFVAICSFSWSMELSGKVTRVVDGDTYFVEDRDKGEVKVRCNGIDAPESTQDFGAESAAALKKLILDKDVQVRTIGRDRYGRFLGNTYVYYKDSLIHVERIMALHGFAWRYVQYSNSEELQQAEDTARSKKEGLWAADNPLPPWEYRHPSNHDKNSKDSLEDSSDAPSNAKYWVNSSSNTIHNSNCKYYGKTKNGFYSTSPHGKNCGICGGKL